MHITEHYIPALRYRWLTPLFDPMCTWIMHEEVFKKRLIDQVKLRPGMHLLDVGCGTGTLTMMIKHASPQVEVTGMDVDPAILEVARKKTIQADMDINFDLGMAFSLPYPENYFDRVVSSMVMHHLTRENKIKTFQEIYRVLRLEGELHLVDFGPPSNIYARLSSMVMQKFEEMEDNVNGKLITFIRTAGFTLAVETGRYNTVFGTLTFYMAVK